MLFFPYILELYNITGKIFYSNENVITGDFLIANEVATNTKYDYPSAEGGPRVFFIAYVNYNSPTMWMAFM